MDRVSLPYGKTELEIRLPPGLSARRLEPRAVSAAADPAAEIKKALAEPIASGTLFNMAAGRESAVIIVSDQTRLAPTSLFLPHLVEEIVRAGIREKDITVVLAAGAHREPVKEEIKKIVGPGLHDRIKCLSSSPEAIKCVTLGQTSRGTPVEIHREVAKQSLKVATGNIEPHRLAAFSGGAKALLPGCAGLGAIEKNHALSVKGNTGRDPDQNEVRADAEEAAELAGLDFIFNVVADQHGRLIRAYAGHPVRAHREGCRLAEEIYCVGEVAPADVVLAAAGGSPKDQNLYQAVKALQNAAAAVKPGGTVVMAACCPEGFGQATFRRWVESGLSGPRALERFSLGFELGGHKAAYAAQITSKCRVHFVSDLPGEKVELLYFRPYRDLGEAFEAAIGSSGKSSPDVLVMPYAGLTFPM